MAVADRSRGAGPGSGAQRAGTHAAERVPCAGAGLFGHLACRRHSVLDSVSLRSHLSVGLPGTLAVFDIALAHAGAGAGANYCTAGSIGISVWAADTRNPALGAGAVAIVASTVVQ